MMVPAGWRCRRMPHHPPPAPPAAPVPASPARTLQAACEGRFTAS